MLIWMLACATPEDGAPSTYAPDLVDEVGLTEDPVETQAALDALLVALPRLNAAELLEGYEAAFAQAEPGCPTTVQTAQELSWEDDCETSGGVRFLGQGAHALARGEDGRLSGYAVMEGRVVGAQRLDSSGSLQLGREREELSTNAWSVVDGAFSLSGAEGWASEGWTLSLELRSLDDERGLSLSADGELALPPGGALLAAQLHGWSLAEGRCPEGALHLRTPAGWSELVIPQGADPESCCGALDNGEADATATPLCVDSALALGWSGAPW